MTSSSLAPEREREGVVPVRGDERAILDRQLHGLPRLKHESGAQTSIQLYASTTDKVVLGVGAICALVAGALNPLVPVIYGLLVAVFEGFTAGSVSEAELRSKVATFAVYYVYLAVALFVFSFLATVGFFWSGERITRTLRITYLSAVMRQNMAFFDTIDPGEISNRIMSDTGTLQEAITSKISILLSAVATFCAAFVVMFVMYWKTALILTPFFVLMLLVAYLGGARAVRHQKEARTLFSHAGGMIEEAFGAIRQVLAFGMQPLISRRYSAALTQAALEERRGQNISSGLIASMNAIPCLIYAVAFWAGSVYTMQGDVSSGSIVTTVLAVVIGVFALIRIAPSFQALTLGIAISTALLDTIGRRSPQDPLGDKGDKPRFVRGEIVLEHVDLIYPSRDQVKVLKDVCMTIPEGKKTAIVGPSGGGKSSVFGLLERFYEPTNGILMLDGRDIQTLNLKWLRQQIGLVDQDLILFDATIMENICYGCSTTGDLLHRKAVEAAQKAKAHEFIETLPEGYQTRVGERGLQFSGGQRQRLAIARALVRDPTILLFDEATSALDSFSEKAVQAAIDAATEQRTTIVIAHRLSTITNADHIVVMAEGSVVDQGTHAELMSRNGLYANLIEQQQIKEQSSDMPLSLLTNEKIDSTEVPTRQETHDENIKGPSLMLLESEVDPDESSKASKTRSISFMLAMSQGDWKMLLVGLACALLGGLLIPAQSILTAELITTLGLPRERYGELRHLTNLYCGLFLLLACAGLIFWMIVCVTLSRATQNLCQRVRETCCERIMQQDVAFFERVESSPSALAGALSKGIDDLAGMGGPVIGGIMTFMASIVGGIVLSMVIGWKLALVCTATVPIVVACGWLRLQVLAAFDARSRQSGFRAALYAGELVRSVRAVASLGMETQATTFYNNFLTAQAADSLRPILSSSALYAASQSVVYLCAALAFWYGGNLIASGEYTDFQVYVCIISLVSGAQIAGSVFNFAPDMGKAAHSAQELEAIINLHHAEHDPSPNKTQIPGNGLPKSYEECHIDFRKVSFAYPARPTQNALNDFTIRVPAGRTLALVGQSGSGKSTCLSLLARFYQLEQGQITVGGTDIRDMDIQRYRSAIALVSQEPIMFSGSLRENIAVGLVDEEVDDARILDVCRQTNLIDFVQSLPEGLSTFLGTSGRMLSGGQKQRLALARALLRDPQILLLDEATSALDSESEAVVQRAIDALRRRRTTVMVAHRLKTVMNADLVGVMDKGTLAEMGSPEELLAKRGLFWNLANLQDLA
ncbi:P-loop containing nucleoside triphosphate hydrolase protein [Didymella exigua CBS 183.55]|uniref:P-loop containing nucleoside triphosphate hydrolase protein n=1 Tax=Didymella exigua CBS 183.55 TaxID=1150837 RepID=A0A6A5RB74_9PLEO|nr:P-loop containing nucleoside triphosphate hydrolase protein [Didymella exigua CBS 183.55]KAF1923047.1 P-loop containing nucleoside triphosphate hydrolase protein [Didymella exigua CBS 183.55]